MDAALSSPPATATADPAVLHAVKESAVAPLGAPDAAAPQTPPHASRSAPPSAPLAAAPSAGATALCVAATLVVGLLVAAQVLLNSRLSAHFGLGIFATAVSFASGLAILTVLCAAEARAERLPFLRWRAAPRPHLLLPGVLGVAFVTAGNAISPLAGSSLFWVCVVVGQLTMSAALDATGFSLAGRIIPLSAAKAALLALAAAGAAMAVADGLGAAVAPAGTLVGCALAAVLVGCVMPLQAALNRHAAALLPSRLAATWWSFAFGTALALLVLACYLGADPAHAAAFPALFASSVGVQYLGGAIGVVYVASTIFLTGAIGSSLYFVALVCGQLAGSCILDAAGPFGAPVIVAGGLRISGIVIVLAAAAAMQPQPQWLQQLFSKMFPLRRGASET